VPPSPSPSASFGSGSGRPLEKRDELDPKKKSAPVLKEEWEPELPVIDDVDDLPASNLAKSPAPEPSAASSFAGDTCDSC